MVHSFTYMTHTIYNDGGRSKVFKTPGRNDCVTRAIAILTGRPYMEVWTGVHATGQVKANGRVTTGTPQFKAYANAIGLTYVSIPPVVFRNAQLPENCIIHFSGHWCARINGVMEDVYNPSPGGLKICFGYWMLKPEATALFNVVKNGRKLNAFPLGFRQAHTMRDLFANNYGGNPEVLPWKE